MDNDDVVRRQEAYIARLRAANDAREHRLYGPGGKPKEHRGFLRNAISKSAARAAVLKAEDSLKTE